MFNFHNLPVRVGAYSKMGRFQSSHLSYSISKSLLKSLKTVERNLSVRECLTVLKMHFF